MELKCFEDIDEMMTIPAGHFVNHVDLDCDTPYCQVCRESDMKDFDDKIFVPKALAYYLRTHFCGSERMHKSLKEDGRRSCQNEIKEALGIK